jgi:RNA recognition motif-containing protein
LPEFWIAFSYLLDRGDESQSRIVYLGILMKTKLYVSNLSHETNETELNHLFSKVGTISSVAIVRGRYSRQSRGIALIEMETEDGMQRAIEQFNRSRLHGNVIIVSKNNESWMEL